MGLSLVLYESFCTVFGYKKRKSCHSPKYSYQIFWGNICYSFGKMYFPRKFVKDHKFSRLEIYSAKLECADIVYIRAMDGRCTSSIKIKKNCLHQKKCAKRCKKARTAEKISKNFKNSNYKNLSCETHHLSEILAILIWRMI